jgi:hydrogenase expression/formation protein HypC
MCLGTPMQVVEADDINAWCEADGQREQLDMRLIGPQPLGTWVLAFMGVARQALSATEASQMRNARQALVAVMRGDRAAVNELFADLLEREPELPLHLRPALPEELR